MSRVVVPSVAGLEAERLLERDVRRLAAVLDPLPQPDWERAIASGPASVRHVVAHLADGADRLGGQIESRSDEQPEILDEPFHDAAPPQYAASDPGTPESVLQRYRSTTQRLLHALQVTPQRDWSWPVWSPLGGVETLASATRRALAHHHVHRRDVLDTLGREADRHEDTVRLVVEFVLDALARRGGDFIEPPMTFEIITTLPGAGTWQLIYDEPQPPPEVHSVWDELVRYHPESRDLHRIERGTAQTSRVQVHASGETVWRAAFGRGGGWSDLDVHGDDDGRAAWDRLVAGVRQRTGSREGLGRLQA